MSKRSKKKVNMQRFAYAHDKALAKARRAASTERCTYCPVPAVRTSCDSLHHQVWFPLCSKCHDIVCEVLSAPDENIQREIDENTNRIAYHGTSSVFLPDILENGLVSRRVSGEVYYSPSASRAEIYAKSWLVGMHAGDASGSMGGVVVSFPILDDEAPRQEQRSDFAIARSVAPSELTVERRIDLGSLSQDTAEYIGYLRNFIGVVDWQQDAYRNGTSFTRTLQLARDCYERLFNSVSTTVLRDSIYVPWA